MENNKNTIYILDECTVPLDLMKTDIINESSVDMGNGKKVDTITIDTCLQSFEVQNWNGRIYGKDLVKDSLDNDGMIQNDIKMGQWLGEYGHPLDTDPKRQVVFDPMRCSHRILNYRFEGNLLLGHVQTLAEGAGQMLCSRIRQGVPAAFSLRSLGSVDLATRRVRSPLKILTYDSVIRPSHIEAYQKEILSESAADAFMNEIMNESALIMPLNESIAEIAEFVKERSENVAKVREMFKLDKLDIALCEDASRVDLILEDGTRINTPIEDVLTMQYYDVLSANHPKRRIK